MSVPFMRRIAPFSPTQVSGCQLWLDAADPATISLSGSTLTQWNDKSGNANNTNTVGGSPSYASNFVTFNGTSGYVVGPYVNATQYLTAFVVGSVNFSLGTYGNYYRLLSVGSTAANDYNTASYAAVILHNPNTTQIGGYRNSQTNYVSVTTNTNFLVMNQYDGTNATLYLNGVAQTPVSSTGSFNTSSYSIGRDVGNTDGGGSYTYWPGTVGEVIIYNLVLTNAQRQNIESYLAQKWGLKGNLPNGHPGFTSVLYPSSRVQSLTPMTYVSTFTPTEVAGCSLWLDGSDASTITQSSGSVSQWNDKSGNAYNFTQGSAGNRPTFVSGATNGLSLLRFSGSGQYLGGGTTLNVGTSDLAIFAVCKYAANAQVSDNGSQGTYVFAKSLYGPANNRIFFGLSAMGVSAYFNGSSYESSFSSYHCVNFVTARASGYTTSYANGTQFAQITGGVDNSSWTSSYNMVVGGYNDPNGNLAFNGLYMNGDICEIIIYIASITNTQRQTIEGYLMWKWGLQANIPVGNLYQTVSPNSTNIFNVTRPTTLANQYPTPITSMYPVIIYGLLPYYQVDSTSWNTNWQLYLTKLAAANSAATASFSSSSVGGTTPGTYSGGVLAQNGKIYCMPSGSKTIGVIDTTTNTFSEPITTNITVIYSYTGGVLAPNGKIYCIPDSATNVGLIDPVANTFTTFGTAPGGTAYNGGVLAPNGLIYCIPCSATSIAIIDPVANTISTSLFPSGTITGTGAGSFAYNAGVLGPNGNIYCIPRRATNIGLINTVTNTFTTFGSTPGANDFIGGVLAPNGKIYCIPHNASSVGVIDTTTNTYTTFGSVTNNFAGGVLGPNGKIYCMPYSSPYPIGVIDPVANTFTTFGAATASCWGATLAPNGTIYCLNGSATTVGVISFSGLNQLPSSNYCLSPYTNKF